MPKPPSIAIPLDLPDVEVLRTEMTSRRELVIGVESTVPTTTCHRCGRSIDTFYGYDRPIRLRHLPILGMVVFIEIRPKRFRCSFCDDHPTTTQQLEWYEPKAPFTKAYERQMLLLLINGTLSDVSQKEGVTPDAMLGVIDRWIEAEVDWSTIPPFAVLGIDEIALKKGHRDYVVVITAQCPDGGLHLLALLPERTKATVQAWLKRMPAAVRRHIRTVCLGMWEAYVTAAEEVLPHAALVIDRFHVAQHYRDDVDSFRKQELKRLRKELSKEEAENLKRTLWPFRKRRSALEPDEQARLDRLLAYSRDLETAYDLREELTEILRYDPLQGGRPATHHRVAAEGGEKRIDLLCAVSEAPRYLAGSYRQRFSPSSKQWLRRGSQQQAEGAQAALLWDLQPSSPLPTDHP